MTPEQRVEYEGRVRNRQAAVALAAALLLMAAVIVQIGGPHVSVNEKTLGLITEHKRFTRDLIGSILAAFSLCALAWTLHWLWGAARAREPNLRPSFMGWIAVAGALIQAVGVVAYAVAFGNAANDFVSHGAQTWPEANKLLTGGPLVAAQIANYLGLLLLAVGIVLVSLNAMRVGLLTRFLGYLGVIAGVLTIIPLVPIPIVEAYWLFALAYLLSGRWPSGVPPAWSSGRVERWPTSAELRAARGQAPVRGGRAKPATEPAPEAVGAPAPVHGSTRSATSKRKRKRRK
jgi:F0F1-type ATP synthase membrane subunit c/vacuolar-type H+-ATPase subunit K